MLEEGVFLLVTDNELKSLAKKYGILYNPMQLTVDGVGVIRDDALTFEAANSKAHYHQATHHIRDLNIICSDIMRTATTVTETVKMIKENTNNEADTNEISLDYYKNEILSFDILNNALQATSKFKIRSLFDDTILQMAGKLAGVTAESREAAETITLSLMLNARLIMAHKDVNFLHNLIIMEYFHVLMQLSKALHSPDLMMSKSVKLLGMSVNKAVNTSIIIETKKLQRSLSKTSFLTCQLEALLRFTICKG